MLGPTVMASRFVSTSVVALLGCGVVACAETHARPPEPPPPQISAARLAASVPAHPPLVIAVHAEDDDADDTPRGTLALADELVTACTDLRSVGVRGDGGAFDPSHASAMAWLDVMRGVARCMNEGELRERRVRLHGAARPQVLVRYLFTSLGVAESRVEMTDEGDAACADDECDAEERRVDIDLAEAKATTTTPL